VAKRWKQRPEGSNWGEWGDDDELGRVNLLDRQKVLQGVREVTEGISFSMSLPLDLPVRQFDRRYAPVVKPTEDLQKNQDVFYNIRMSQMTGGTTQFKDVWADDYFTIWSQYSTQWDAFCHVGFEYDADGDGVEEAVYYNGYRAGEDLVGPVEDARGEGSGSLSCAKHLGMEHMAVHGMQGRGVMVDLVKHFGREFRPIDLATLKKVMDEDGVVVEPGDMLLLHTGYATQVLEWGFEPERDKMFSSCTYLDGQDQALLDWIAESQISALIADNHTVEGIMTNDPVRINHTLLPIHHLCLFLIGVPLGELWYLDDLAKFLREKGRSRFLLTAPPLRVPGTCGSPLTPIATV
jgi:kynurenine formamidase